MSKNEYIKNLQNGNRATFEALMNDEIQIYNDNNQLFYNPVKIKWDVYRLDPLIKISENICIKKAIQSFEND